VAFVQAPQVDVSATAAAAEAAPFFLSRQPEADPTEPLKRLQGQEFAQALLNLRLETRRQHSQLPLKDRGGNRHHAMEAQRGANAQSRVRKVLATRGRTAHPIAPARAALRW